MNFYLPTRQRTNFDSGYVWQHPRVSDSSGNANQGVVLSSRDPCQWQGIVFHKSYIGSVDHHTVI